MKRIYGKTPSKSINTKILVFLENYKQNKVPYGCMVLDHPFKNIGNFKIKYSVIEYLEKTDNVILTKLKELLLNDYNKTISKRFNSYDIVGIIQLLNFFIYEDLHIIIVGYNNNIYMYCMIISNNTLNHILEL